MAEPTARTKTSYVILREKPTGTGADTALVYEPVTAVIEANSADHALRLWAENAKAGTAGGMYVAIPSRSFRPTKVAFATQTIVKLGDAS